MRAALFIALALLAVSFAACVLPQREEQVSESEFKLILLAEKNFTVFMNTTGSSSEEEMRVYQCGTDLSGSLGLLGKNVTPYVVDNGLCVTLAGNVTLDECLRSASATYSFFIGAGSSPPIYFKRRALVFVPANYTGACRIAARYGGNSTG